MRALETRAYISDNALVPMLQLLIVNFTTDTSMMKIQMGLLEVLIHFEKF